LPRHPQYSFSHRTLIYLLLGISIIFFLIATRQLLVPLFLSVLLAYALYPASSRLERYMPRILTNFLLIIGCVILFFGVLAAFGLLVASFSDDLPQIQEQLQMNINVWREFLTERLGISDERIDSLVSNIQGLSQYIGALFEATTNTILILALIPVYAFLLLHYRNKFREFLSRVTTPEQEEIVGNVVSKAATVVPHYIKGLLIVFFILIIINSAGFYIIGVNYALLMGIVAAFFNLIPYLGTIIGYLIVFLFVLVSQEASVALLVVVQFFIVQFLENNILTPNITGSHVEINPLVTIFSLIAGGMLWGLPGMFIVIPYLALIKVICDNVPNLEPIGFLMGIEGVEDHAITIDAIKRTFGLKSRHRE